MQKLVIKYSSVIAKLDPEEYKKLEENIVKEGCIDDIVVNKDSVILDGHNRYEICNKHNIDFKTKELNPDNEIQWIYLHQLGRRNLTDDQRKIYIGKLYIDTKQEHGGDRVSSGQNVHLKTSQIIAEKLKINEKTVRRDANYVTALNKIEKNNSGFVEKKLNKQIKIAEKDIVKIAKTPEKHMRKFIEGISSGETFKQVEAKIKQEERKEEAKDIKLANVFNGDAVTVLKTLKANSVDCVVCDPPYGVDYNDTRATSNAKYKDGKEYALELLDNTCKELKRVLKKDAHLYLFCGYSNIIEFKTILMKYFDVQDNPLIWVKNNHTLCDFQNKYASKYEMIWFCRNGVDRKLNYKCSPDILNYDIPTGKEHSAQKPVELLKYLIGNSTVEKEVVLDMFAGSGSTGIAAKETNRNYVLVEVEKEHYELIIKNLKG